MNHPSKKYKIVITTISLSICLLLIFMIPNFYYLAKADRLSHLGYQHANNDNFKEALYYFSYAAEIVPGNEIYQYYLGDSAYWLASQTSSNDEQIRLLKAARRSFERALKLNPLDGRPWQGLGRCDLWLWSIGDTTVRSDSIEENLLTGLSKSPANPNFLLEVVNYYLYTQQPDKSLGYLESLAATAPDWYLSLKDQPGWNDATKNSFRKGLEKAEGNPLLREKALFAFVSMAVDEEDWRSAIDYTEQLLSIVDYRRKHLLFMNLGRYHLASDNRQEALMAFCEGLRSSKEPVKKLNDLIWAYRQADSLDAYIELCQEAAKRFSGVRAELPLLLGKAYLLNKEPEMARYYFRRSLEAQETPLARRYLAELAIQRHDWGEAELESQRATVLEEKNDHHYFLFARSLEHQKKYEAALDAINLAIQYSSHPKAYYFDLKGWIHWRLMEWGQAKGSWQKASLLNPKNCNYFIYIARSEVKLGNLYAARRNYNTAQLIDPQNGTIEKELKLINEPE